MEWRQDIEAGFIARNFVSHKSPDLLGGKENIGKCTTKNALHSKDEIIWN